MEKDTEKSDNGQVIFRWVLGLLQAAIVIFLGILVNGQSDIASELSSIKTRINAVEPVVGAYGGLTNRMTAIETIVGENSRRIADERGDERRWRNTIEERLRVIEREHVQVPRISPQR